MTAPEALMWRLDSDPALRSSFMGITLLDTVPDPARLRRRMEQAVASVNALRERVVEAPFDIGPPRWEIDARFDLDYHVRHLALPAPGSARQLLDLAALIYSDPFDHARPLWQFTIVEGLEGGGAAMLAKMHHVLSDGVGAVRLSVSFLDLTPDGSDLPPAPRALPAEQPGRSWFDAAAGALGPLLTAPSTITRTVAAAAQAPASLRSLGRQLGLNGPPRSSLWDGQRSYSPRFDLLSLDLDRTRAAAKAMGGTINDAFVTVIAGAAGEYHRALDAEVEKLRVTVPISVRHDKVAAGNAWVPARLTVPTAPMDTRARFELVAATMRQTKREPSLNLGSAFAGVLRRLPTPVVVQLARQQTGTVDFACSNVRGAPFDLWIAGAKVIANHPFGPTAGVAFNATVLSYLNSLDLGLNSDTGAVTNPRLLLDCVENAAADLYRVG